MDEEMIRKIHHWQDSDLPDRIKVAMRFAENWVLNFAQMDDDLWQALTEHFEEKEILELAIFMGTVELSHKFNTTFGVVPRHEGEWYDVGTPAVPQAWREHMERLGFQSRRRG